MKELLCLEYTPGEIELIFFIISRVAKSKKLAKRQAAHQMISTLKSMPGKFFF